MSQVTMEIVEPYERQGKDVIVNIRKSINSVEMPPKTATFYLRLKDHADVPDDQIRELATTQIWEHLEKMPDEA